MRYQQKAYIEQAFHKIWNLQDKQLIDELFDQEALIKTPSCVGIGPPGYNQRVKAWHKAFISLEEHTLEIIKDGNKIARRWKITGIHQNPGKPDQKRNKRIETRGTTHFVMEQDVIVDLHNDVELSQTLSLLQGKHTHKSDYYKPNIKKPRSAELMNKLSNIDSQQLSKRQLQCLSLWLSGNAVKTVGSVLGISPKTVETHIEYAKMKLHIFHKHQLYDTLIRKNILHLFIQLGSELRREAST